MWEQEADHQGKTGKMAEGRNSETDWAGGFLINSRSKSCCMGLDPSGHASPPQDFTGAQID